MAMLLDHVQKVSELLGREDACLTGFAHQKCSWQSKGMRGKGENKIRINVILTDFALAEPKMARSEIFQVITCKESCSASEPKNA
tara:strand:+ start:19058 stop:19312 length:255 start_codon:yes stop_codon:yes gene_type:complete